MSEPMLSNRSRKKKMKITGMAPTESAPHTSSLNATGAIDLDTYEDSDERTGAQIVLRTLEEPLRQIAENVGLEGSIVVAKVRDMKPGEGFNAATGEYGNLVKAGVIDPTMVTRSALQNAASIAKNILTTECVVAEMPEKEPMGMPGGGGMPDMM